jgi:hypothetical protein
MTIPIKIQCECGQRYAFDADPVAGALPTPVVCPVCGADGTATANAIIAQSLQTNQTVVAPRRAPLRVATPTPAEDRAASAAPTRTEVLRPTLLPGQVDRAQAEHEARAKILWGDSREEVFKYLRIQGFGHEEAFALVQELFLERAATIRSDGIRKIVIGTGLICVPIVSLLIFFAIGVILLKIFAATVVVGFWGVWMVFKGAFMVLSPKTEAGDASDQ